MKKPRSTTNDIDYRIKECERIIANCTRGLMLDRIRSDPLLRIMYNEHLKRYCAIRIELENEKKNKG